MNLKSVLSVVCAFAAVSTIAGCASMGGGELVDGQGGAPGRVVLTNNRKGDDVTIIMMSRCGGYTMGGNRLANREWIRTGEQKVLEVSPGCWDVEIGDGVNHQGKVKANIVSGQDFPINYN